MNATAAPPAKTVREPVVLVGAHRSGTTLLGLMLRGHSAISWLGEFEYNFDFIDPETGSFPDKDEFHRLLDTDRRFRAREFAVDPELAPRELVDSFLIQTMERQDKPRVGGVTHRHFDRVLDLWPDARVIHLVRDGRDVALSRIRLGWAGNVWTSAPAWGQIEQSWDALKPRLAADQVHEIRYEDLVAHPREELHRVCSFLGIEAEAGMLDYPGRSNYEAPDPALAQQWHRKLSPRECRLLDAAIGEMLVRRGYPLGSNDPLHPGWFERAGFSVQDWVSRLAWRFRRYGARLVLAEFVTRKLGLAPGNQNLRLQIDAIAERHLR